MHPAISEALIFSLMGISGVAWASLLGVRQPIPLAIAGFAASVTARILSAFGVWSAGAPQWTFEAWLTVSVLGIVLAAAIRWREWRTSLSAVAIFGALAIVALSTKYVFDIGEQEHSDSTSVLSISIFIIQGDYPDSSVLADYIKRGIAYPLMLALGPEGRILGGFTPLVYLFTFLAVGWVAWRVIGERVGAKSFTIASVALAVFLISVPMFRMGMFYLNAHTLMGFGVTLMVVALLIAGATGEASPTVVALTLFGGLIGATSRIEGIILVVLVGIAIVGLPVWNSAVKRIQLGASLGAVGLSFTWWQMSLGITVSEDFGLSNSLLMVLALVGATVASLPLLDPVRSYLFPVSAATLFGMFGYLVLRGGNPLGTLNGQIQNLVFGVGGWGTFALVFFGSAVALGLRHHPVEYRRVLLVAFVLFVAVIFSKAASGGGFGRGNFVDSVNRMYLHAMPTMVLALLLGYSSVVGSLVKRATKGVSTRKIGRRVDS